METQPTKTPQPNPMSTEIEKLKFNIVAWMYKGIESGKTIPDFQAMVDELATQIENAVLEREAQWCENERRKVKHKCSTLCSKHGCEHAKLFDEIDKQSEYNISLQTTAEHLRSSKSKSV